MLAKAPQKFYDSFGKFPEFFYFYLSQHMKVGTRAVHYVGTWVAIASFVAAIYNGVTGAWMGQAWSPLIFVAGLFYMYFTAFLSHWFIEKNQPATFVYPLLSVGGDLRMFWLMTTRRNKKYVVEIRQRLANGWLADREGLWPPELATKRRSVPVTAKHAIGHLP